MCEEDHSILERPFGCMAHFIADESGDGAISYSLFASIMVAAIVAASTQLGGDFKQAWTNLGGKLRSSLP
jgi:Flp pilus assembly pilin Flp